MTNSKKNEKILKLLQEITEEKCVDKKSARDYLISIGIYDSEGNLDEEMTKDGNFGIITWMVKEM